MVIENENLSADRFEVRIEKSGNRVCDRCRRYSSHVEDKLCKRCQDIIDVMANDVKSQI